MVGLMATSSKRACAVPKSAAPRAPAPADPYLHRRCSDSSVLVFVGSLGPGVHKICLSPPSVSGGYGVLILNVILPLLPSCWGFSFALGSRVSPHGHFSTAQQLLPEVG